VGGEGALGAPCFSEKGAIKSGVTVAGFASESGVTRMAGFAGARRPHPGRHTTTPADFRYALAVSLRTPVACSMRRKGHPSFPSAMTCCFFSSLKSSCRCATPAKHENAFERFMIGLTCAGRRPSMFGAASPSSSLAWTSLRTPNCRLALVRARGADCFLVFDVLRWR